MGRLRDWSVNGVLVCAAAVVTGWWADRNTEDTVMDDIERNIAEIEVQLARLDPQLVPLMEPLLLDMLLRLREALDRDAPPRS